ncbi:ferredoxin [Desulfurivibrio sp. D14AmB]|uniref:ferredoxin n=1 Tax=Desulfurivibrio sp. D14AmB TaxID=3374370 RepID=UPI00376EF621
MARSITLDQDECIGCQSCVEICPEVFGFDQEIEKAFVLKGADGDLACAQEAADSCPVACIVVG